MTAEPVVPRPSASVILVRDGPDGLESFMVRRHARSPAFPSAYVFPGGTIRPDDTAVAVPEPAALADRLLDRSDVALPAEQAAVLFVCAIRELFEEAGVLLVRDAEAQVLAVADSDVTSQERLASTRLALQAGDLTLANVLSDAGWTPAFDLLVPFSHWVTPSALAARWDTWFFIASMPTGQNALHDTIETSDGLWLRPADVLSGDYHTVFATAQHLQRLAGFSSTANLLEFARRKPIRRVQPEMRETASGVQVQIGPDLIDCW